MGLLYSDNPEEIASISDEIRRWREEIAEAVRDKIAKGVPHARYYESKENT